MKNFRKKTFKKMFALTMAFSIMLISCTSNSTDSTPITNSEANLTGKNFFNAIYFKRGPLVDKIYRAVKIFSYISENKKGYGIIQRRKYY